jgi:hypothetical protein
VLFQRSELFHIRCMSAASRPKSANGQEPTAEVQRRVAQTLQRAARLVESVEVWD